MRNDIPREDRESDLGNVEELRHDLERRKSEIRWGVAIKRTETRSGNAGIVGIRFQFGVGRGVSAAEVLGAVGLSRRECEMMRKNGARNLIALEKCCLTSEPMSYRGSKCQSLRLIASVSPILLGEERIHPMTRHLPEMNYLWTST